VTAPGGGDPHAPEPRPLDVRPEARAELREAARFYDDRAAELGDEFVAEVERAFRVIAERPAAGSPVLGGRRRVLLRRFPYAVVYRELPAGGIRVLAVGHLRRRPGYWRGRDQE